MHKFLIMAIACIVGFQQTSADVCKLKANWDIKAELDKNDEVWTLKKNRPIAKRILQ